ncbi:MAG: hypothetical protein HS104_00895 [Polyangiaceae bacterium]|nr:hypothetical protein [Polyangiaceae bacterium]MCL4752658.1 hypothetical protein [Myxococcales bacterium]
MQYTLRNIPRTLDQALRQRARREKKTLNQVVIETLAQGLGLEAPQARRRDLRDLVGARPRDPALEQALDDQRRVDPELWR